MKSNVLIIGAGGVARVVAHKCAQHNRLLGGIHLASRTVVKCREIVDSVREKGSMEVDGVIGRYAIGGAVGSIFWLEPITTKDLDVFVMLPTAPGGSLLTLGPIYEYLLAKGYVPQGQFIVIEGWAVEFVPPGTPLEEEALAQSVERDVNGVLTRVFSAEHLAAICLQVGRPKDHDRVIRFVEAGALDAELFEAILRRHDLMEKWQKFQQTYLES